MNHNKLPFISTGLVAPSFDKFYFDYLKIFIYSTTVFSYFCIEEKICFKITGNDLKQE